MLILWVLSIGVLREHILQIVDDEVFLARHSQSGGSSVDQALTCNTTKDCLQLDQFAHTGEDWHSGRRKRIHRDPAIAICNSKSE